MYHNKKLVFATVLCTIIVLVGGGIYDQIETEFQTFMGITPAYAKNMTNNSICFNKIGCFGMDEPWKSHFRPIPPPLAPELQPVTLFFFSKENPYTHHIIKTFPDVSIGSAPFHSDKPTFLIIHGFINNGRWRWMHTMKEVLLAKKDANVILVDWGPGAEVCTYLQAVANIRVVAKLVTRALQHLINKNGLDPANVHLIGHSLGAHISGYIGKAIPGISRITAMDAAQPAFEGFSKEIRLDKSDAKFVEVIHTDGKPFSVAFGFGLRFPHGHVDFYMNGGAIQPGCIVRPAPVIKTLYDLAYMPLEYICHLIMCDHSRSIDFTIEAFNKTNNCVFWGRRLTPYESLTTFLHTFTLGLSPLPQRCTEETCVPFGFETIKSPLRGSFIVTTGRVSPFCIPELAPLPSKQVNGTINRP